MRKTPQHCKIYCDENMLGNNSVPYKREGKNKLKNKVLKVIVLDCGVCPCGWDWVSVL